MLNILESLIFNFLNKKTEFFDSSKIIKGSGDKVIIYQNCNYTGHKIELSIGNYDFGELKSLPGSFSEHDLGSIIVPKNIKVMVFSEDNYSGKNLLLTSDKSCLNFKTKSIKIENIIRNNISDNQDSSNKRLRLKEAENEINKQMEPHLNLLDKYKQHIDFDKLLYNLNTKNETVIQDLDKKIKSQQKSNKELNQENMKKIKLSKINHNKSINYEKKSSNLKNINIVLVVGILLLIGLLYLKFKKEYPLNPKI